MVDLDDLDAEEDDGEGLWYHCDIGNVTPSKITFLRLRN